MFDLSPPDEFSHSVSHYDKSIIRKMRLLQDVNGFCPAKEGFNDRHERAEAGRCIDEDIGDLPRMKMLRGKKN